jgi:hypothetical protein
MLIQNLRNTPDCPVIIAAYVSRTEDSRVGDEHWYFNLTIDGEENIGTVLSKRYDNYDEAIYGMNARIIAEYNKP